jgi:hypothetical protein
MTALEAKGHRERLFTAYHAAIDALFANAPDQIQAKLDDLAKAIVVVKRAYQIPRVGSCLKCGFPTMECICEKTQLKLPMGDELLPL